VLGTIVKVMGRQGQPWKEDVSFEKEKQRKGTLADAFVGPPRSSGEVSEKKS